MQKRFNTTESSSCQYLGPFMYANTLICKGENTQNETEVTFSTKQKLYCFTYIYLYIYLFITNTTQVKNILQYIS